MSAYRNSRKFLTFVALAVVVGIILAFLLGELAVRTLSTTDEDGNVRLGKRYLDSERPELSRLSDLLEQLEAREGESRLAYDAGLGWIPQHGYSIGDDRYRIDDRGVRTGARAAPGREGPTVALYGDSFAFGLEVHFEESWGYLLERRLAEAGDEHRVLNLGVGGYGMGQAYLRWRASHPEFRPDVVVFGFQPENVLRNVNIVRAIYDPRSHIPFSKPRFVIEGNELQAVNVPCIPPREVLEVLRNPRSWEFLPLETFYVENASRARFWQSSRLLCLVLDCNETGRVRAERKAACYRVGSEAYELTLRIIQHFRDEVHAAGSRFVIVHLPYKGSLADARDGRPMTHEALLAELARRGMTVVDPTPGLLELARREGMANLFQPNEHYSPSANRVVADVLAPVVRETSPAP